MHTLYPLIRISGTAMLAMASLTLAACSGMTQQEKNTAIGAGVGALGGSILTGGSATGTLGGELFDDFFKKYEMKLSLEAGPRAKQAVVGRSMVRELDSFCRNAVRC